MATAATRYCTSSVGWSGIWTSRAITWGWWTAWAIFETDTKLIDINGDGLTDVVRDGVAQNEKGKLHYQINTGRGFLPVTATNITFYPGTTSFAGALKAAEVVDYDGDGRQDLLLPNAPSTSVFTDGMDVVRVTRRRGRGAHLLPYRDRHQVLASRRRIAAAARPARRRC